MPCSMTGFARLEAQHPWGVLSCEIRSVNHRYLEPSIRMPETMRNLEPNLREVLKKFLHRGKIEVSLHLKTETSEKSDMALNLELVKKIHEMAETLNTEVGAGKALSANDYLRWPGVIQAAEIDPDELASQVKLLFSNTLQQLVDNRQREGKELDQLIVQRLEEIAVHVEQVRQRLPEILSQHQAKLRAKLDTLAVEIDEERFSQEAIYIAQKADVAEELDRLEAHITEVKHTLNQSGPIGRRLDFLMQELNREANTLSSKSMASDTTQSAVDIKVLIEQMREQVQNIE